MAIEAPFYTAAGEAKGNVELPEALFGTPGKRYVLHEVVKAYQGNLRRGTSMTKTRGLVSGGGRKPWKQKGTGNARAGSIRSPLWRKGGIIFGPQPRSYRVDVDASKRVLALQTALFELAKASAVSVIDSIKIKDAKTKSAAKVLSKAGKSGKTLLVLDQRDAALERAIRNLPGMRIVDVRELNALSLLASKSVVFTTSALDALSSRFPKG
jgi:large subunit ribosomal protein L4